MMEDPGTIPPPAWSELLPDLIGSIVTRLPTAADCARFRVVCRSWRSAMRHYGSHVRYSPPWTFLPGGSFLASFHGRSGQSRRLASFPDNATCLGSTGSWLLLYSIDAENRYQCLLHDPLTGATVPLAELDTIIGDLVSHNFFVYKVLMPRGPCDDIALVTSNYRDYPFVLARYEMGVSVPKAQRSTPRGIIVDINFLGGKLYGITNAEVLYFLDVGFGEDGVPIVTTTQLVIDHPASKESFEDDDFDSEETNIFTICNLSESRGKIFMVRRQLIFHTHKLLITTRKVEVFEADIKEAGAWKTLVGGLDGQALFMSNSLIKFVPACGDIEEDAVYFMETGEIFSIRSQSYKATRWDCDYPELVVNGRKWIFPPDLVV